MPRPPPLLVGSLALLLGGVAGWFVHAAGAGPVTSGGAGGVACPGQRLEARLELLGHGAWYGFTVDRAATLRFRVDLPAGVRSTLVWGRLGAGAPGEPAHLPEPATAERLPLDGPMDRPFERRATALGPHVLFVEQPPLTMGEMHLPARVVIEILPDAAACADAPR